MGPGTIMSLTSKVNDDERTDGKIRRRSSMR